MCREKDTAVAFGMLEHGDDGNLYSSLVFLDSSVEVVRGRMADGSTVPAYRRLTLRTSHRRS